LACVMLLAVEFPEPESFAFSYITPSTVNTSIPGRRLLSRGSTTSTAAFGMMSTDHLIVDDGLWWFVWFVLTLALGLLFFHFATVAFTPIKDIHILFVSIGRILYGVISVFGVVYLWVCCTFLAMLFTIYPRSGSDALELFTQMNSIPTAFVAMLEISLIGNSLALNSDFLTEPGSTILWGAMGAGQTFNVVCFVLLYITFVVASMILLLNLLIALLTYTFDSVRASSLQTSRLIFSRNIMNLELAADLLGMPTRCGEKTHDGRYAYTFRSVTSRHKFGEDSGDGYVGELHGGSNPFEEPLPTPIGRVEQLLCKLQKDFEVLKNDVKSGERV